MEEKNLICIGCPMGCPLTVKMEHGEVVSVTGNTCKRGDIYARKEVTNPTRIVTSTVRVTGEVCHTPRELFDLLSDDYRTYLEIELTKGRRELTEDDVKEADTLCKRYLDRWKEELG